MMDSSRGTNKVPKDKNFIDQRRMFKRKD